MKSPATKFLVIHMVSSFLLGFAGQKRARAMTHYPGGQGGLDTFARLTQIWRVWLVG